MSDCNIAIQKNINIRNECLESFLLFTKTFFEIKNKLPLRLSNPIGRESHYITVSKELTNCFKLNKKRLIINMPPGTAKSTMVKYFVAWCFAHYPDCRFLYISSGHDLASEHTYDIKSIISLPQYRSIFGIELKKDSLAKDNFKTTAGGAVKAFGVLGGITGHDAGLPNLDRFSGCVIMDDLHKMNTVHSVVESQGIWNSYLGSIQTRCRSPNVPIICIGQRGQENDICGRLIKKEDGYEWEKIIIPVELDGNSIDPLLFPSERIEMLRKFNEYVFYSQYQQNPLPLGGSLFKEKDFKLFEAEPEILATFITIDTAETEKTYNDASVFSFWGLYKIQSDFFDANIFGLHWIDCVELRVEPKELVQEFFSFYAKCSLHSKKPVLIGIEKKSVGVSLISFVKDMQGINIVDIDRTKASGSKTDRFIRMQPFIAKKQISLPIDGEHTKMCIEHMTKISPNSSHAHDDIADTVYDAIDLSFIRKLNILYGSFFQKPKEEIFDAIVRNQQSYNNSYLNIFK